MKFLNPPSTSVLMLGLSSLLTPSSTLAFQIQQQSSHIGNSCSEEVGEGCQNDELDNTMGRRTFWTRSAVAAAGASFASLLPSAALADAPVASSSNMNSFEDTDYGFRFQVPSSFERSEQNISGRRKAVFFVDSGSAGVESLVFVAYTPVRDDFTGLGSFGSVDEVGQATILPKGTLAGGEEASADSKMISAVAKKNAYFYDYVVVPQGEGAPTKKQHYRTIFTLLPMKTGAGQQAGLTLVTITAQTTEEKYSEGGLGKVFDDVMESYGKL